MSYCKYCGRELKEGEVCNCRQQIQNNQNASFKAKTVSKTNFDIDGSLGFFKSYFKSPDTACKEYSKKEYMPLGITLGLIFVLFSGLSQLSIGINAGFFKGRLFLFGVLFGLLLLLAPMVLNTVTALIFKSDTGKRKFLYRPALHTPVASLMMLLTFILGMLSIKTVPFMYTIVFIIYAVSMISTAADSLPQNDSFLRKTAAFFMALIFILLFVLLFYIEIRNIGEYIIEFLYDDFLDLFI